VVFSDPESRWSRDAGQLLRGLAQGALILALAGAGCGRERATLPPIPALFPAAYTDTLLEFPHLRFADRSVSLNDRCPVRKVKLNRRLSPLFVNGRPVGFC